MKFNVQRVLTPAYLTSIALLVVGVVLGLAWYPVAAWVFVLAGIALNAMAVSVTEIHDAPRGPGALPRRRPSLPGRGNRPEARAGEPGEPVPAEEPGRGALVEPDAETDATPTVPRTGSSPLRERR